MLSTVALEEKPVDNDFVVESQVMKKLLAMAERVARHTAAVLITGETGTGKELIARTIHLKSLRCHKPWVDINCAALPEHLVESELFGYERGAFSGAENAKPGMFELANGGTLFLDEIGELEPKVQVKLLRVLDGAPYYRLGGNRKISIDVRLVAATNRNLEEAVRAGRFRRDLFHRIGQFQLKVPPLRERPQDVVAIANFILRQYLPGATFALETAELLQAHAWPGNVRELRNAVIAASLLTEQDRILPHHLPPLVDSPGPNPAAPDELDAPASTMSGMERKMIFDALKRTAGHQDRAAQLLGISRRTLSRKLREYRMRDMEGPEPPVLGAMQQELQEQFRAEVQVPIRLTSAKGESIETRTVNVSLGGFAAAMIVDPVQYAEPAAVVFTLPESNIPIAGTASIAWAGQNGCVGFRYIELAQESRNELHRWLLQRQRQQGWAV